MLDDKAWLDVSALIHSKGNLIVSLALPQQTRSSMFYESDRNT